jgi:transcriptional regulator with XRE-family HTH domain
MTVGAFNRQVKTLTDFDLLQSIGAARYYRTSFGIVNNRVPLLKGAMTLAEYLNQIIDEKGITPTEIQRRSNGAITDSYIGYIRSGKGKNVSSKKLIVLAQALDIDVDNLFRVNAGLPPKQELWTPHSLVRVMEKAVDNPELGKVFQILSKQKPAKIKALLKQLEKE